MEDTKAIARALVRLGDKEQLRALIWAHTEQPASFSQELNLPADFPRTDCQQFWRIAD
jgi:hypothetical protein